MPTPAPTTVTYKLAGQHPLQLDLYRRPGGSGPAPVVVWIHGGALITGNRHAIHQRSGILEQCLDAGLAVASIDYRLAPETKLPEILADLTGAFAWVRQAGLAHGLDPERIGVMGHSAGGYLTLMSAFAVEPRPRAVVAFYGYGDISGDWYARPDDFYNQQPAVPDAEAWGAVGTAPISEPDDLTGAKRSRFYLWTRQRGLWPIQVAGRDPEAERAAFAPWCPLQNVTPAWPPTLLLHGTADTDVPFEQSTLILEALTGAGVSARLITIAGGAHGFDRGVTTADLAAARRTPVAQACADSVAFLAQHLTGT